MTSPTGPPRSAGTLQRLRVLAGAQLAAPFAIGLAMAFVLGFDADYPATTTALALAAVAVAGFLLAQLIGYRCAPATGGDPADVQQTSVLRFQTGMILRLALTEAPVIIGLVASFVLDHGLWPYVIAATPGVLAMYLHVWPGERIIARYEQELERDGHPSYLRRGLGLAA